MCFGRLRIEEMRYGQRFSIGIRTEADAAFAEGSVGGHYAASCIGIDAICASVWNHIVLRRTRK